MDLIEEQLWLMVVICTIQEKFDKNKVYDEMRMGPAKLRLHF